MNLLGLLILYGRNWCGLRLNIVWLAFSISWLSSFSIIILAFLAFLSFSFSFAFPLEVSILIHRVQIIIGPIAFIPVLIIGPIAVIVFIPFFFLPIFFITFFTHHVSTAFPSSFSSAFSFPWSEEPSSSSAFSFSLSFTFASSDLFALEPSLIPCVVSVIIYPENIF